MKGKIIGSRYKVLEYIAKGGFGKTYLAEDTQLPGKDLCVVKQLSLSAEAPKFLTVARRLFKAEAEALYSLGHHEQIPELLAYFEESEKFYLVQQYIEGQTIEQELNSAAIWSEANVVELLQDCLKILEFIHEKGVIHRDIKPANLIRRHGDHKIVLVDFGTVKNILQEHPNVSQLTVAVGTKGYMPAEQARGIPRPTSDLYALGMIGIQALTRVEPLELEEDDHGELIWTHLAEVNPGLAKILTEMTRYHFEDRYQSAQEALQALNAFSDVGVTKPQSYTTINQSLSDDLNTNYVTTVAVSNISANESAAPALSANTNLPSQHYYISLPIPSLDVQTKPISELAQPILGKKEVSKTIKPFVSLAIALGSIIIGGIYLFMQQPAPESPQIPDSSTPRMDQGDGFRDNL
ncbi:MAG: serine/threonine-protein kinase [Waterburya sp.]